MGKIQGFLSVNLWGQVRTLRGLFLVSRTDGDPPPLSLLFPSPPCVRPKNLRVWIQNVPVCTGTTPACGNTCARGAGTHGDVLNLHTEVFSACQAAPHTTPHHTHTTQHTHTHTHTTQHHNTQHHTETETERHRDRDRERQRKRDKTRQEKRRRDNKREETRR